MAKQKPKIRKIEFAPPLSIPIPEYLAKLLKARQNEITEARAKEAHATSLEIEAKKLREEALAQKKKAITEGDMIVEVLLASVDMSGKPHQLMPELDMVVVDPN